VKLLELEIRNVRGITELTLSPGGDNVVIWGPNGSGKSAVVDAVDFLLTGKISRLTGEGTAGVSLKAHGPHIDHKPEQAWVSASVLVRGYDKPVRLRRALSSPSVLQYPPDVSDSLQPVLNLASKGQHALSRREILRYVTAEAGKRASEVQALLNLDEVELTRKTLVRLTRDAKAEVTSAGGAVAVAEGAIAATLGLRAFDAGRAIEAVNELRQTLGGDPLSGIDSATVKRDLVPPSSASAPGTTNPVLLRRQFAALTEALDQAAVTVAAPDRELRSLLSEVRNNQKALRELGRLTLFELGVSLIPEDGACPLCGAPWEPGRLREHLLAHIESAKAAAEKKGRIDGLAGGISAAAATCQSHLDALAEAALKQGLQSEAARIATWSASLRRLVEELKVPLGSYPSHFCAESDVGRLFASTPEREAAEKTVTASENAAPAVSREQTAWDALTRLEENWRAYEGAIQGGKRSILLHKRATAMSECFEDARDQVLTSLYGKIESRFSQLYRLIHSEDEPQFECSLRPDGAGLSFEVDFYGRGKFPPLALHSEGHQDTMGLCLYLALAERLTETLINLTILDDVVMSVDAGHRRQICMLLSTMFPGRQFLITTHDKTWARQLVTTGVVPKKNSVEFARWTLETGPHVVMEALGNDFWSRIQKDIESGEVPAAAARLRRGAEEFFEHVCDRLQASVQYRSDGRWELSDFAGAAIGAYAKYLREGKAVAQSWRSGPAFEKLQELETVAAQVIKRSQVEQWAVNENVHYSRWGEFTPEDFQPVVEAWRDLLNLFVCPSCQGSLFLAMDKKKATSMRCRCGAVDWNLVRQSAMASVGSVIGN
jgi:energy-coupling factor transporter ATP-binding protein EcfA2